MKKIAKRIIVAVLVLSMTLGVFAGCGPAENKSLAEKYGITMNDKTITYDGEKHDLGISVDNTILQGKSYEVTYDVNGAVVTKVEFTDAGEYTVTANVKVADDETVYPLTKKLTIKKAELSLEVGNLFLRQLQGVAFLGNPKDLFKDAKFIGKDTNAILGTLAFEVYSGGSKVNDLSTLKPTEKASAGLTVKVVGMKDLKNYEVKLSDGKLFVLAGAEFDSAKLLKDEIATVPTATTINTLDYYTMRAFAQGADHIVSAYPSTNEIQRLMCGTVDVNTVKTLKKTAETRVANVYDIDDEMETSVGKVIYLGASHDKNDMRANDEKLSELKKSAAARARGEYGDLISLEVVIYDTVKYKFSHILINGVEYATGITPRPAVSGEYPSGVTTNSPLVYSFGKARYTTGGELPPTDSYTYGLGATENPGSIDGLKISNEMLGALTGKTTLNVEVIAGEVHDAGVYLGANEIISSGASSADEKTGYPQMSEVTITSKGTEHYKWSTNTAAKKSDLIVGKEYKFTIATNPGYGIVSVEIGNKLILANAIENGSFTIKLTEDHLTEMAKESIVKIVPTFERVYSFEVKASVSGPNYKTLSNSNKDGIFVIDAATIKLIGVSQEKVPTIPQENALSLSIVPEIGWVLTGVALVQAQDGGAPELSVNLTDEFEGSSTVTIDLSDTEYKNFKSNRTITIKTTFRESYPIVVKSTLDDKTTNATKKTDKSFAGEYGIVEVLNLNKDSLDTLAKEERYYIRLVGKTGYVPKSVKVDGRVVVSTTMGDSLKEGVRYPMLKDDTNMIINSQIPAGSAYKAVSEDGTKSFGGTGTDTTNISNYALIVETKIDAGEEFVIEVEYEAYYFVSASNELPNDAEFEVEYGMKLNPISGSKEYEKEEIAQDDGIEKDGELYNPTSALIKIGNSKSYYCYYSDNKSITARIKASTHEANDYETNKFLDPIITIGCDGSMFGTGASVRHLKTTVSTAVTPQNNIDQEAAKKAKGQPIAPGGDIEIRLICDGYDAK